MQFRTREKSQVLDDLVAKLKTMPETYPDRPALIRMIIGLRREIERRPQADPPAPAEPPGAAWDP